MEDSTTTATCTRTGNFQIKFPEMLNQGLSASRKQRDIVVMGFRGVGKSSIVGRFVNHVFESEYNPTIESTYRKRMQYGHESLTLTIHDTTGQDELTVFSARHYIGVHGYIIVYDVTSKHSFEMARYINDKILTTMMGSAEFIPRLLVGNKCDVGVAASSRTMRANESHKKWVAIFSKCLLKQIKMWRKASIPYCRLYMKRKAGTVSIQPLRVRLARALSYYKLLPFVI